MGRHYTSDGFKLIPLEEITTPSPGDMVHQGAWWAVTPDDEVVFYVGVKNDCFSPQCNENKNIAERLVPAGCTVKWLDMTFYKTNTR